MRNKILILILCGLAARLAIAEHSPLLPRPQQIRYGAGSLSLRQVHIEFSSTPSSDDQFAAEQLRRFLKEQGGIEASIGSQSDAGVGATRIVLEREGSADEPLGLLGETPGPASREAYDLIVTGQRVRIHARSSAGIFYGVQTLRQLVEREGVQAVVPEVEIHDWPSLAYRGTMLDISHGPLPREEEIERQLDFLARWKANQYYLYSEDSIELDGYPLLNAGARLSKDEVRRIVAYARQRHIDVVPNFDLYGHQHDLFRIEEYSSLSDQPGGTEFDPTNPKVMPLMADWVNQLADLFPSSFVNIGFDETFQIEAATHATGAASAPTEVFVKQLTAVTDLFKKHGKHVMAYDDIMVKYQKIIPELPPGLIAVAWYYTSEDPIFPMSFSRASQATTRLHQISTRHLKTSTRFWPPADIPEPWDSSTRSGPMMHNFSFECLIRQWPMVQQRRGNPCRWTERISSRNMHRSSTPLPSLRT